MTIHLDNAKIAQRYAKALFQAALEQNQLEAVSQAIQALIQLYKAVPQLAEFFANPTLPLEEKQAVLEQQFKKAVPPLVGKFFDILVESDRLAILPEFNAAYTAMVRAHEGMATAQVTVPVSMAPVLQKELQATLQRLFHYRQVDLDIHVDPSIIAGAIVRIGDKIIDGSYYGKFETLQRQLG